MFRADIIVGFTLDSRSKASQTTWIAEILLKLRNNLLVCVCVAHLTCHSLINLIYEEEETLHEEEQIPNPEVNVFSRQSENAS